MLHCLCLAVMYKHVVELLVSVQLLLGAVFCRSAYSLVSDQFLSTSALPCFFWKLSPMLMKPGAMELLASSSVRRLNMHAPPPPPTDPPGATREVKR